MFRKRQKKTFPPGTFIPTPARVCAIIQLCLAFTVLLWNLSLPFAGELFTVKSEMLLFQDVMGIPSSSSVNSQEKLERLERNHARFKQLPVQDKTALSQEYEKLQVQLQKSFFDKTIRAFEIVLFEIPPFQFAWLILSFVLPILLLKRVEGAVEAIWLLPLLAVLFAFDNRLHNQQPKHETASLYPTEEYLVNHYLAEPLSDEIFKQKDQLLRSWQSYLTKEWAPHTGSVEDGEFAFNLSLLKQRGSKSLVVNISQRPESEPLWLLACYIFWNAYFAFTAFKCRSEIRLQPYTERISKIGY